MLVVLASAITLIATALVAAVLGLFVVKPAPLRGRPGSAAAAIAAGAIIVWLPVTLGLIHAGFYSSPGHPLNIVVGVMAPIGIAVALWLVMPGLRSFAATIPLHWLIRAQVYRIIGGVFLLMFAAGRIPAAFALPAGFGDMIVGLGALYVAGRVNTNAANWRVASLEWSVVGIIDLIAALTLGFGCAPTPLQFIHTTTSTRLLGEFPLALFPTFLVPCALILHALALRALAGARATSDSAGVRPASVPS